jgi:hypothetical protein
MTRSIRRHLYVLHAYVAASLVVFLVLGVTAFTQAPPAQKITELTAERINIVDADGTLRLVISNKDRMHPGVIGGKVIQRARPVAGLLFFNDHGDEAGGLTVTGREQNGRRAASAGIMFDQLGQDQTIGFDYSESNGRRSAAFKVWDRPDSPLSEVVEQLNAANALTDAAEREAAVARVRATAPRAAQRVFVGKTGERVATVMLADAQGRDRLVLKVDPDGNASIEFLDEQGKVVQRIAPAGSPRSAGRMP